MRTTLSVLLVGYLATFAALLHVTVPGRSLLLLTIATVLYTALIAVLVRARLPRRATGWLVLLVGAALQLLALTRHPLTSDDAFRYAWDGKVQLNGIDPYRYAPASPHLAQLRDSTTFGLQSPCTYPIPDSCTAINRPDVHTVYPPIAQAAFALGRVFSLGAHGGLLVFQILGGVGALAVSALLMRTRMRQGAPLWPVALWAWCPVVVSEFGNNAHIDWLAVLFGLLALDAGARGHDARAGWLVGAAIATKLYPALLLPSLMRRRPRLVVGVAGFCVLLVYLPHLAVAGREVIGYLPGYLHEEGYASGSRLLLLGAVLPHPADTAVGIALLALTALWIARHADPVRPEQGATLMVGAAMLVATPAYAWYPALLIALAVLSSRYEWMVLAFAASFVYARAQDFPHWPVPNAAVYLVAALGTAFAWRLRNSTLPTASAVLATPATYDGSRASR